MVDGITRYKYFRNDHGKEVLIIGETHTWEDYGLIQIFEKILDKLLIQDFIFLVEFPPDMSDTAYMEYQYNALQYLNNRNVEVINYDIRHQLKLTIPDIPFYNQDFYPILIGLNTIQDCINLLSTIWLTQPDLVRYLHNVDAFTQHKIWNILNHVIGKYQDAINIFDTNLQVLRLQPFKPNKLWDFFFEFFAIVPDWLCLLITMAIPNNKKIVIFSGSLHSDVYIRTLAEMGFIEIPATIGVSPFTSSK